MTRQTIDRGSVANDKTGDTLRVAAGKINDNFEELYGLLGGDSGSSVTFSTAGLVFEGSTYNSTVDAVEQGSNVTYQLDGASDTITLNTATQTLTNKTLTLPTISI